MPTEKKLYLGIIHITEDYLGPAAQRFIDRQIRNHLRKEPGGLTKQEFAKLADWAQLAMALLTNDENIRDEYARRLEGLKSGSAAA